MHKNWSFRKRSNLCLWNKVMDKYKASMGKLAISENQINKIHCCSWHVEDSDSWPSGIWWWVTQFVLEILLLTYPPRAKILVSWLNKQNEHYCNGDLILILTVKMSMMTLHYFLRLCIHFYLGPWFFLGTPMC